MNIKKSKRKILTRQKIQRLMTLNAKHYETLSSDRKLLSEVYDDNFRNIEKSVKGSQEHMKLLVIENALNEQSVKLLTGEYNAENRLKHLTKLLEKLERKHDSKKPSLGVA